MGSLVPFQMTQVQFTLNPFPRNWLTVQILDLVNFFFPYGSPVMNFPVMKVPCNEFAPTKKKELNSRSKFCRLFLGRPNWFSELSRKTKKAPCFGEVFDAAGKILKKRAKKDVLRHFLENFDQKIVFFRRALSSQN